MLTSYSLGCDLIRRMRPPGYRGAILRGTRTGRSHLQLWQQLPVSFLSGSSLVSPSRGHMALEAPEHQHSAPL